MAKEPTKKHFSRSWTRRVAGGSQFYSRGASADTLDEATLAEAQRAGVIADGDYAATTAAVPELGPGSTGAPGNATAAAADEARAMGLVSGFSPESQEAVNMPGPVTMAPSIVGRVRVPTPPTDTPVGMGADNLKGMSEQGRTPLTPVAAELAAVTLEPPQATGAEVAAVTDELPPAGAVATEPRPAPEKRTDDKRTDDKKPDRR